jgi:hypothetical protein
MISIIDHTGTERFLGNLVPSGDPSGDWPVYGDSRDTPMFARSEWGDLCAKFSAGSDHPFRPYVHDQDGVGQCNCDATTAVAEHCRAQQGLPFVALSAADLYDRINGGSDRGSLLEDALREMTARGVGTAETCGTLWRRGMRTASAEERGRFRMLEVFHCPTFGHVFSAALSGFAVNSGIMWREGFQPDGDGWLTGRTGSQGGHAVYGYKPAMRQGRGGVEFGIWHQNSWTERWGLRGCVVFPEWAYEGPVGGWFACRLMVDEGGVVPPLKG